MADEWQHTAAASRSGPQGLVTAGILADGIGVLPILDAQAALYLACGVPALLFLRVPERVAPR